MPLMEGSGVAREVLVFTLPNSERADGILDMLSACAWVELRSVLDDEYCLTRLSGSAL